MASVSLQRINKTFPNGVHALRDVNFEVADGEFFVLVGPSGSGKTTLLRLIAGLDHPTSGDIFIDGRPMKGVAAAHRDVAMVFQNAALYPHMTVRQNLAFGLKSRRLSASEIEHKVAEIAEILSVGQLLTRRPAELSGGERGRVAVGRAIVRRPKVLLLDEPLTGLDPPLRAQLRAEFATLHSKFSTTVIYVTHDQAEAMSLGDRIGVMNAGEIQQIGKPLEVYAQPANTMVAAFIGNPGMNLIPGEVCNGFFRPMPASADGTRATSPVEVGQNIQEGAATLGVRPSDLLTSGEGAPLTHVTIDFVERLGQETLVHFRLAAGQYVARLTGDSHVRVGDQVQLSIRPGSWHLFSGTGGSRIK